MYYEAIDPVFLRLGPLSLHWYGLMYLIAFIGCFSLALRHNSKRGLFTPILIERLFLYVILGVVLGGRVGYVFFYGLDWLIQDPLWLFKIWQGGMSFHGGLIGVLVAIWLFSRNSKVHYGDCLDFVAAVVPIGLFCGRIGNFINQELWGRPTEMPWGIIFSNDPELLARHPSQLYEAFLEGILLLWVVKYCYDRILPRWAVSCVFAIGYALARIVVEQFRLPEDAVYLGLTRGQWLSVPMIVVGVYWLFNIDWRRGKSKT